mmetsp:Transcript_7376/g.6535  ORF Transcript_7376/g.6535 Transcript_7376/m.6535 type:complete len:277 (-) Transcript_7376:100-930(-)
MKLTESKVLNWGNIAHLDYLKNRNGRRHLSKVDFSLEKTKRHLGVAKSNIPSFDDSPTFKVKPTGRKQVLDPFSNNQSFILDLNSYSSSKNGSKLRSSASSGLTSDTNSTCDYKKLLDNRIKINLPKRKRNSNFMNTKDISGAFPMKFKHRNRRIVKEANCKSHFLASGTQLKDNAEKEFRSGIKIVNPYQNLYYKMNELTSRISSEVLSKHTRNRSLNHYRSDIILSEANKSVDFSLEENQSSLPRVRSSSKELIRNGSSIIKMRPIKNIISVYK